MEVFPKRPKNTKNYHCEKVQDIDVYLSPAIDLPEGPVLIDVEKILFFYNLTVEGFRVSDYFKD